MTSHQKPQQQQQQGGVADYFTVLGIGNEFQYYTSKPEQQQNVESTQQQEEEDEEYFWMERFYREITSVGIVTVMTSSTCERLDLATSSNDSSSDSYHPSQSYPIHTANKNDDNDNNETSSMEQRKENIRPNELDGYTIVWETLPAGKEDDANYNNHDQYYDHANDGSFCQYSTSINPNESSADDGQVNSITGTAGWNEGQVYSANLHSTFGLRSSFQQQSQQQSQQGSSEHRRFRHFLGQKVAPIVLLGTSSAAQHHQQKQYQKEQQQFHIAYRRRSPEESNQAAIAECQLHYVRIHTSTIIPPQATTTTPETTTKRTHGFVTGASIAAAAAASRTLSPKLTKKHFFPSSDTKKVPLCEFLSLPEGYQSWVIPTPYQNLHIPTSTTTSEQHQEEIRAQQRMQHTHLFFQQQQQRHSSISNTVGSPSSQHSNMGIETLIDSHAYLHPNNDITNIYVPKLIDHPSILYNNNDYDTTNFDYVPILAIRYQNITEEERFHEDPAMTDINISFLDDTGKSIFPSNDDDDDDDIDIFDDQNKNDNDEEKGWLSKTKWSTSGIFYHSRHPDIVTRPFESHHLIHEDAITHHPSTSMSMSMSMEDHHSAQLYQQQSLVSATSSSSHQHFLGYPIIIYRKNKPHGLADIPFSTSVLDRFPQKNYKGLPLPEEELPMFCYPTGCRLHRALYQDAPVTQCYGFVVKNERGDSIYVSCVSFMEPLTQAKIEKLNQLSTKRRRTSLPHRFFCERRDNKLDDDYDDMFLTGFDEMTTFENKTICLVGRYPFWTAFRRFLSHLHILSGSTSDLPLERWISHLLLSVPLPKPGESCIMIPLSTLAAGPMILSNPPVKDFPLIDLPFQRLLTCLDAPTIVTIVLGFLALEKKVIIMSTYPSMVSDVCELLRSLLFPFDLCAPYVPRLTQPFMSCLDFPGAIFVGIHDDGTADGLASMVRKSIPEDTAIVDLDTGEIDCSGDDRYEELKNRWDIIPSDLRSDLVSEIKTLCCDADIEPGQEQIDLHLDIGYDENLTLAFAEELKDHHHEDEDEEYKKVLFDERALRDCFLRFFCSILGGYERFLLVPDMDFLISGNEWFDTEGFLSSVSTNKRLYLNAFVSTQMFQSFIQKRTEASDVHCLLFDECISEFHSSKVSYGRMASHHKNATNVQQSYSRIPEYNLLVDQCATELPDLIGSDTTSCADTSLNTSFNNLSGIDGNNFTTATYSGDIVTAPSHQNLPPGNQYVYCIDGNPSFPHKFDKSLFFPSEPDELSAHFAEISVPVLTRSDRELDDTRRREKMIMSHRGMRKPRRCLWQLPKIMGSHFLGSWLMCIPSQVSQSNITSEQQEKYLLRALGAVRLLRSRQRIVTDEASYRCLMVACGRCDSDRRVELVKLFGLLRSEGVFPSAVTLGQYTRGIAEGFSKRSSGLKEEPMTQPTLEDIGMSMSRHTISDVFLNSLKDIDINTLVTCLDHNLAILEYSGRRWRQRRDSSINNKVDSGIENESKGVETNKTSQSNRKSTENSAKQKKRYNKSWSPIMYSTSFSPHWKPSDDSSRSSLINDFQFIAMWSRTTSCHKCGYIPLDEEIQAGWSENHDDTDGTNVVRCPKCKSFLQPLLGYNVMTMDEAINTNSREKSHDDARGIQNFPSQLTNSVANIGMGDSPGTVPYLSPSKMRLVLENYVEEYGEEILERTKLRRLDPTIFFNLWWFSARFSLPLPLSVIETDPNERPDVPIDFPDSPHQCMFATWDRSIAEEGCRSAAKSICEVIESFTDNIVANSEQIGRHQSEAQAPFDFCDSPLLSNFNINSFAQDDWNHPDLSKILVALVEACDKREFQAVISCVCKCNDDRKKLESDFKSSPTINQNNLNRSISSVDLELDCYRTLLYLARYQCTSAFHVFFPATIKACKGYHYWCAIGTPMPIFDRMFADALRYIKQDKEHVQLHHVSDIALGFRCIFGHMI